jgi:xanthine/CO dehydrogenase XdhC/CoxF family maturation factor
MEGIAGKEPEVIAVSVAAQLLRLRSVKSGEGVH